MQQFRTLAVYISLIITVSWGLVSVSSAQNMDTFSKMAERMGRIHAAAIYCSIESAHDFGVDAMEYFKLKGNFEAMREIYGLALLNAVHEKPTADIGTNCDGLSKIYKDKWKFLKKSSENMKKNSKKK